MNDRMLEVVKSFETNVDYVYKLMDFDRIVLDFSINTLKHLSEKLKKQHNVTNPYISVDNSLSALQTIRQHDSLRSQYDTIFNQCIVLLVSYFSSTLSDIFRISLNEKVKCGVEGQLAKEEIKFTLSELAEMDFNIFENIGEIIESKKEISFQDMQSIKRAFKDYLCIELEKDKIVNNIITGQACRHIIVHAGNVANSKLIKQLTHASPRDVKSDIEVGQAIQFTADEITIVGDSMKRFINIIISKLYLEDEKRN